jgi:hypothetical protein
VPQLGKEKTETSTSPQNEKKTALNVISRRAVHFLFAAKRQWRMIATTL